MSMNDPLGDMLTRIRNAYGRKKTKVSTPASRLRARVLDVMKSEGYIRDYSQVDFDNGKSEIEIELKYFEGQPVIREIARVSKPGRRVYVSVKSIPAGRQRPRRVDPVDAQGRDGRPRGARRRTWAARSSARSSDLGEAGKARQRGRIHVSYR